MSIAWKADPAHTEIQFKVKHLMITTVTGYFRKFDLEVVTETEDFNSTTSINFTADSSSIDTNNAQRDTHLKSGDFFNAEKYGRIQFTGTRYEALNDKATLQGNLTIRGITKPITLDVNFAGTVVDPYGQKKAGFAVTGRISRKEFELKWNAVTEAGSVVVSDEVRIVADIQLIQQQ
ncbi:MAG: polyisoprenoid-binding protein [Chitinophagaceae bacterium]|nr:polyisoprenoid-binding protein [Chitinophagaceae bacterium]